MAIPMVLLHSPRDKEQSKIRSWPHRIKLAVICCCEVISQLALMRCAQVPYASSSGAGVNETIAGVVLVTASLLSLGGGVTDPSVSMFDCVGYVTQQR